MPSSRPPAARLLRRQRETIQEIRQRRKDTLANIGVHERSLPSPGEIEVFLRAGLQFGELKNNPPRVQRVRCEMVETMRIELTTSALRTRRSPS